MPATGSATSTRPAELPQLSPWAPVLQRGPGELQIGVGHESGLVLSGVPDGFAQVLGLADGRHTHSELLDRAIAYEIEPALIDDVLRTLTAAGLLVDHAGALRQTSAEPAAVVRSAPGPASEPLRALRLRLVGAGRLGTAVANAAVRAGVGRIFLADNDPVDPTIHRRPGLATTQAQALAAALSDTIHSDGLWPRANTPGSTMPRNAESSDPDECGRDAAETVQVVDHWSKPERTPLDLTVIATDYAEPDPAIGRDFVDGQHPHLYLRPSQGGAVVGPFVRPAATPCLRCIDLTRRDADPAWATMLPQLCRTRMPVTPLLAAWAAVTAITQIVAVWTGQLPSTLSGTVELTPQQAEPRFRRWPAHPQCGCGRPERW